VATITEREQAKGQVQNIVHKCVTTQFATLKGDLCLIRGGKCTTHRGPHGDAEGA